MWAIKSDIRCITLTSLQFIDKGGKHTRLLERVLRAIVAERGILPSYLYIHGVQRISRNPVGCGGFADVWIGEMHGQRLALKVLRVSGNNMQISRGQGVSKIKDWCSVACAINFRIGVL